MDRAELEQLIARESEEDQRTFYTALVLAEEVLRVDPDVDLLALVEVLDDYEVVLSDGRVHSNVSGSIGSGGFAILCQYFTGASGTESWITWKRRVSDATGTSTTDDLRRVLEALSRSTVVKQVRQP